MKRGWHGSDEFRIIYTVAPGAEKCKLLIIRDLHAFNGEPYIIPIFTVSFIVHKNSYSLFLPLYNSRFLKIKHVAFKIKLKLLMNDKRQLSVSKNACSINGHIYHTHPLPQ